MQTLTRALTYFLICCGVVAGIAGGGVGVRAQGVGAEAKAVSSISGRVMSDEDKGLAGVLVALLPADNYGARGMAAAKATTDAEGRYRMTGVAAGRYSVMPLSPAFVVADITGSWPPGKPVSVAAGETIEGMDFTLTRGGVITGRVADADGKPVVNQSVVVSPVDDPNGKRAPQMFRAGWDATDDRGVYRIYGLPAGRYRVSTGEERDNPRGAAGGRSVYLRTFYPNVREESRGKIVEVEAGGEATDIDITVGAPAKTYSVRGRVVDAEKGQPLSGISVLCGVVAKDANYVEGTTGIGAPTNARGEFQLNGILPGRYALFIRPDAPGNWYADLLRFEVSELDVGGLELKLRRGNSISGVVVLEGGNSNNRAVLALLSRLTVNASIPNPAETGLPVGYRAQVKADGSFQIDGLQPGTVRLGIGGWEQPKGFSLLRIERGGVEQREGIEVAAGEQVAGLRLVVAYGSAIIRGQVKVENGTLPEGTRIAVYARRAGGDKRFLANRPVEADMRGRFMIDGLAAGDYEVGLTAYVAGSGSWQPRQARQNVTVGETGETPLTIVLDLSEKQGEARP